jgi:hypothetical protein
MMRSSHCLPDEDFSDIDLDFQSPVPPMTEWQARFRFCGLSVNYVPVLRTWFLEHWEIHIAMPLTVLFIIYSSLAVYLTCELRCCPDKFGFKFTAFLVVTSILFGYCYGQTILIGPGYLPFYYPLANPNSRSGTDDYMSGMVTNPEQEFYVKNLTLPERTAFFRSARRVVVRPDHFCGWATSFIGKKNHKVFFLFNFWGLIYTTAFSIATLIAIIDVLQNEDAVLETIFCIIYLILGIPFALLTGSFVCSMTYEFTINRTTFEGMKQNEAANERGGTCIANWEEVFGPREKWYLWLIPILPFDTDDDRTLVARNKPRTPQALL